MRIPARLLVCLVASSALAPAGGSAAAVELSYSEVEREIRASARRADGLVDCGEETAVDSSLVAFAAAVDHDAATVCSGLDFYAEAEIDGSALTATGFRDLASAYAVAGPDEAGAGQGTDFSSRGSVQETIGLSVDETSEVLFVTSWELAGEGTHTKAFQISVRWPSGVPLLTSSDFANGGAAVATLNAGVVYRLDTSLAAVAGPAIAIAGLGPGEASASYDVEVMPLSRARLPRRWRRASLCSPCWDGCGPPDAPRPRGPRPAASAASASQGKVRRRQGKVSPEVTFSWSQDAAAGGYLAQQQPDRGPPVLPASAALVAP